MEATARGNLELSNSSVLDTTNFELKVKMLLQYSLEQWDDSPYRKTRMQKLCNSLRFWKDKLKPAFVDNALIFTLFSEAKDSRFETLQIIRAVEQLDSNILVKGVSELRNPRYLCLYFDSKEQRDFIRENFKLYENFYVVYLDWASTDSITVLKIHWLPISLDLEVMRKEVYKYAEIVSEERALLDNLGGRFIPSGKMVYKVKMKQGISVEAVPHLTEIGNMEALITVQGRLPLCLTCSQLGHISKQCKSRYCRRCRKLTLKEHVCKEKSEFTYADIAKRKLPDESEIEWSEDEEEQTQLVKNVELGQELAQKIKELEHQINNHDIVAGKVSNQKENKKAKKAKKLPVVEDNVFLPTGVNFDDPSGSSEMDLGLSENVLPQVNLVSNKPSFEGKSTLTDSPQNKRSYGRGGQAKLNPGKKAQTLFDGLTSGREFVFHD